MSGGKNAVPGATEPFLSGRSFSVPAARVRSSSMGTPLQDLDKARLRAIADSNRPLAPQECAERARLAAALIEPGRLDRAGSTGPGRVRRYCSGAMSTQKGGSTCGGSRVIPVTTTTLARVSACT